MSPEMQITRGHLQRRYQVLSRTKKYYSSSSLYRKVTLMIVPRYIWNVSYHARSNSSYPQTSPCIVPATRNCFHHGSVSHMKRHLQCAEQHDSPSKLAKYCSCHEKWLSRLILLSYMNRHLHCAEQQKSSSNVTKYCACHAKCFSWLQSSSSHMKRHFQCAEHQGSPSNLTKYCACHEKWLSWLILLAYETSGTMRGATALSLQRQQILRLLRKMTFQDMKKICWKRMKRHLHWRRIRRWSERDPTMKLQNWTRPFAELTFASDRQRILYWNLWISRSGYLYPNFTKYCVCHEKSQSKITKCCACHAKVAFMTHARYIWNVSYTLHGARPPEPPPNSASACVPQRKTLMTLINYKKRHLQRVEQHDSPSNLTKYCNCHVKWHAWLMPITYLEAHPV